MIAEGSTALELAWVVSKERVAYAAAAPPAAQGRPRTAATELMQGAFELLRDQSFFVLRQPIMLSGRATPLCRGMAKAAAKRLKENQSPPPWLSAQASNVIWLSGPAPDAAWMSEKGALALWPEAYPPAGDADFMRLARRLAEQVERGATLHRYSRPVAALIVDRNGTILSWAVNASAVNKTRHAEINAAQALLARAAKGIPIGARVYSTLKPCRMCAGAIWQAAERPASISVVYAEDDGVLAQGTVLDQGSDERRRASRCSSELAAALLAKQGSPP